MNNRKTFDYLNDVEATWEVIDRLSRMVWERDPNSKGQVHKAACAFFQSMTNASRDLPHRQRQVRIQPPFGANVDEGQFGTGWRSMIVDQLADLVVSRDVGSVAEAFLKATPVLDVLRKSIGDGSRGFYFRGQRNIEWPIIPNLARDSQFLAFLQMKGESKFFDGKYSKTSQYELEIINRFIEEWCNIDEVDVIDNKFDIPPNDPSWWFRMQHYGTAGAGTRLLDLTSSIPAALLFACVNWETGLIDSDTDGIMYLFVDGMNANRVDFAQGTPKSTIANLFDDFPNAPVFFTNPPHNECSKAQAGAFLWWPEFWKQYPGQTLFLRILKERKREIVKELLLFNFGPKDVVRGERGRINEIKLRADLGL